MEDKKTTKYSLGITNNGRPPTFKTEKQLRSKIEDYFQHLEEQSTEDYQPRPTMTGMALFLGFASRQSMYDYAKKEKFSYTIKRAQSVIAASYEEMLLSRTATGAIFALKNMGWSDKSEVDVNAKVQNDTLTADERDARIKELIAKAGKKTS